MNIPRAILLTALGMIIGFWLPDLDLKLRLFGLLHRSMLTHSCLIPLLIWWASRKALSLRHYLLIGLCAAVAVHLCFDLFPLSWDGFALITIPFYGRTTALISWLWIAGNSVVCLYLALRWMGALGDLIVVLASVIVSFVLTVISQHEAALLPLVALVSAATLAAVLASRSNSVLRRPHISGA